MSQPKTFQHPTFGDLDVILINNVEHFNLEHVARSLGYTKIAKRKVYVRWERVENTIEKLDIKPVVHDGQRYINESELYDIVFEAGTDKARSFRKWVTSVVLPSIRKTGGYVSENNEEEFIKNYFPSFSEEVKQAMVLDLKKSNQQLKQQIEKDKPKVLFADSLQVSKDSILIGELAKILRQNGIDIGEKRLFQTLRDNGYLIKSGSQYNLPTQRSMDLGIMEIKVGTRLGSGGESRVTRTTKITGKGQMYFVNKFIHAASKGA